jgi:lipopolysaccharide/colanic/teichoic acid biosynthesis glycosyltransferase
LISENSLVQCLRRSPIKLVKLDLSLDEDQLQCWANACGVAGKLAYLNIPSSPSLPHRINPIGWHFKRSIDWLMAMFLLLLLSPLMLILAALIYVSSPGPIFVRQWTVGERGKLFQLIKFRATALATSPLARSGNPHNQPSPHSNLTPIGSWMWRYSLDQLPVLLNVLRGDMSLVGPRPQELHEVMQISTELQHQLNVLPGITGAWRFKAKDCFWGTGFIRSELKCSHDWSLLQDLKYLLLSIPKWISEFGMY